MIQILGTGKTGSDSTSRKRERIPSKFKQGATFGTGTSFCEGRVEDLASIHSGLDVSDIASLIREQDKGLVSPVSPSSKFEEPKMLNGKVPAPKPSKLVPISHTNSLPVLPSQQENPALTAPRVDNKRAAIIPKQKQVNGRPFHPTPFRL